jgi:NtrC-family two-component system response regulator AlgB
MSAPELRQAEDRSDLRVLVVDDDKNIRLTLGACLEGMGCEVTPAATPDAALAALAQRPHEIAFLDLRLGTASGFELLPKLLAESPGLSVVIVTAHAAVDSAVRAIQAGAADYLA